MNRRLFLLLYGLSEKNNSIRQLSIAGTKLSYYIFIVIFIFFGFWVFVKNADYIYYLKYFLVTFTALSVNTLLRKTFKIERPFKSLDKQSFIGDKKAYSFPSNHAASAMAISVGAIFVMGKIGAVGCIILFLAFLTGLSRIMTGVHYPADVAAGWFVGGVISVIGFYLI